MNRVVEDFLLKVERHVIMGLPNDWEWFYDEKNDVSTLEDKEGTIIAKMVGQHLTIAGSESLASFTTGDLYDHHDAEGFINLFGLSCKVRAMKMQENGMKLI